MSAMFLAADDWVHIGFRLILALLVGCIIGLNRQKGGRPAGMRTFMLVSMGAALFVMIPLQAEGDSSFATTNAVSRTIQGVTTGIGFLGAGLILQESPRKSEVPKVRGLTDSKNYARRLNSIFIQLILSYETPDENWCFSTSRYPEHATNLAKNSRLSDHRTF
ncbi:MgtC/SapB family protein [Dolichospermum lemmermannii CS-548]|uniref:MgtC/SapB family protein n=1 Tax=Dolichospermum lemmermannii TaxID=54295 RepID=UPI00232BD71B|nr:MgtC/SapB family protein [Dolichospermum lemmermannii]MDB9436064.1 MgtC/SapB family protein [Dolichospermum lemmermannii CS-548]